MPQIVAVSLLELADDDAQLLSSLLLTQYLISAIPQLEAVSLLELAADDAQLLSSLLLTQYLIYHSAMPQIEAVSPLELAADDALLFLFPTDTVPHLLLPQIVAMSLLELAADDALLGEVRGESLLMSEVVQWLVPSGASLKALSYQCMRP